MDNPGLATDLAILQLGGSTVERRAGYRVVRTPANPLYHWGNFLVVGPDGDPEDAERWLAAFAREFPGSRYVAIALPRSPEGPAWVDAGVPIVVDDVLAATAAPACAPLAEGYRVVPVYGGLWDGVCALACADLDERLPRSVNTAFSQARIRDKQELVATGRAMFFAALEARGEVAADLGIVCCGPRARYQDVITAAAHRRRGLAAHLLGVAARWAADHGCAEWVIVAAADGPAGRVYRRAGFAASSRMVAAYRPGPG